MMIGTKIAGPHFNLAPSPAVWNGGPYQPASWVPEESNCIWSLSGVAKFGTKNNIFQSLLLHLWP